MVVKLLAERGTGRLLGGQIVGGAGRRQAHRHRGHRPARRMRVDEIVDLDLAYAPPFSGTVWDPVQSAHAAGDVGSAVTWQTLHGSPGPSWPRATPRSSGETLCRAYSDLVDAWLAELLDAGRVGERAPGASRSWRSAATAGPSSACSPTSTCCSCTTGGPTSGRWPTALVPDLGRGPEARPRRAHRPRGAGPRRRRPRHRHLAAPGAPPRRRRRAHRRPRPTGPSSSGRSGRSGGWPSCSSRVRARHEQAGEVAFLLEPDLKEGRGGLRDVHALRWAEAARSLLWEGDDPALADGLRARCCRPGSSCTAAPAGRATGCCSRSRTRVAAALGEESADELMHTVAGRRPHDRLAQRRGLAADRRVAERARSGWRSRRDKPIGPGLVLRDGEVHLTADADPAADPTPGAAGRRGGRRRRHPHRPRVARPAGRRLRRRCPTPWPDAVRAALRRPAPGRAPRHPGDRGARPAGPVGARAARVGGRAEQAAAQRLPPLHRRPAPDGDGRQRRRPRRPHRPARPARARARCSTTSARATPATTPRWASSCSPPSGRGMGFAARRRGGAAGDGAPPPAAARRRHPARPRRPRHHRHTWPRPWATRSPSACWPRSPRPTAWPPARRPGAAGRPSWSATWCAAPATCSAAAPPRRCARTSRPRSTSSCCAAGAAGAPRRRRRLTVVAPDRPGLFSRVAGVLALHGLGVLDAAVTSVDGMALEVLRVESSFGPTIAWDKVVADLEQVLDGRLALQARLAERARVYGGRAAAGPDPEPPRVVVDNDASPDGHRRRGARPRLDRRAVPDHPGPRRARPRHRVGQGADARRRVVDAFYVRGPSGGKLEDPALLVEIERALLHELSS